MRHLIFCAVFLLIGDVSGPAAEDAPRYATDVRPILARNCFACHGADAASREAELRLDVAADRTMPEAAAARAIIPGQPEDSEMIQRITSSDPELIMPPPDAGRSLTAVEVETLRRWVDAGGKYETHWSFVPPQRPAAPTLENDSWSRGDIDRFVLRRLHEVKLAPSPPADPWTLIRRVYLDLIGLPPSPAAADEFAQNPSPEAFEAIVDDLLQSPRFGEHWAAMWLDLARYADTKGYEKDQPRNIWRYRDWVIDALNSDMPFDQFTTEQIAGDLLEAATTEQILATAFHRNTMTNDEGGTDNEEFRIAAVKDRVDTTIQVWMGLTMGCAKCHSHKYDPISQQEYYQFMAYFNQTQDADRPDDSPRMATPTAEQRQQMDELNAKLTALQKQYEVTSPEFMAAQRKWEAELAATAHWIHLKPLLAQSTSGSTLQIQTDQSVLASGQLPGTDVYELTLELPDARPFTALRIEALTHDSLPGKGPGRNSSDPNFVLSELSVTVVEADGAESDSVSLRGARADFSQDNWDVAKAIDGKQETGWAISPQKGKPHQAVFELAEPIMPEPGRHLKVSLSQQYAPTSLLLGCVRLSASTASPELLSPDIHPLTDLATVPTEQRTPQQKQRLAEAFRKVHPQTAPIAKQLQDTEAQLAELRKAIPQTPIMKDLPPQKGRETFVHVRGNFLEKGDSVGVGFPAALVPGADGNLHDRRDVARWLVSSDNPLTARVAVNRIWGRFFGRGIVETEEDFGTQGALPTHPELLDWLAVEFRDAHAWSLKKLCRSIVTSATYQQSAAISESSRLLDPQNQWFSRGPRFRLSAETIRDQALAAAGLLSDKIGGPSVMPPQPGGIWRTTYSALKWETPSNEDRHRRGLYTFLRRTSPYPSMITFDGTSREVCQIRRIRTNTPLQALVTMNDPVYVEAAGELALAAASAADDIALERMFRRVLIRPAATSELATLKRLLSDSVAEFQSVDTAATEVLQAAGVADVAKKDSVRLAALTVVAGVLLNLDETLSKP